MKLSAGVRLPFGWFGQRLMSALSAARHSVPCSTGAKHNPPRPTLQQTQPPAFSSRPEKTQQQRQITAALQHHPSHTSRHRQPAIQHQQSLGIIDLTRIGIAPKQPKNKQQADSAAAASSPPPPTTIPPGGPQAHISVHQKAYASFTQPA